MTKLEMVIKGMEECKNGGHCSKCCYANKEPEECVNRLLSDAISLLKEQQAVEPKVYEETRYTGAVFACGECHHALETARPRFCMFCGKPIKWE